MSDVDTGAAEEAVVETLDAEPVEDKATRMGWRPKDEFKGDDSKWVDAAEYVRRGEEILPIVQANNAKLEKAVRDANKRIADMNRTMSEFAEHHTKTEQRAYQRAVKEIADRQAAAVEANDLQGVQDATEEYAELKREMATKPGPKLDKAAADPEFATAMETWKDRNPWYQEDPAMTDAAAAFCARLNAQGVPMVEQLAQAEKFVRKEFPHRFTNPNRSAAGAVESNTPGKRTSGKSWADLPSEAKTQGERFVKQGLLTKEQYAKDYFA